MSSNTVPITVAGNLTQNPGDKGSELRYSAKGTAVLRFTVAFNPRRFDGGEWKDGEPSFYSCTAFGALAENIAESLHKGDRVLVTGTWGQQHWVDEKGEKRSNWQMLVDELAPSLKYATATVKKMARSRNDVPPDDEWATASPTRPDDFEPAF